MKRKEKRLKNNTKRRIQQREIQWSRQLLSEEKMQVFKMKYNNKYYKGKKTQHKHTDTILVSVVILKQKKFKTCSREV